jgi:5'-phosphate synthase pdxT subunit
MAKVGVLALQGSFKEHIQMLQRLGVATREVRLPRDLEQVAALIIPGGESTTIGKLALQFDLLEPLRRFALGRPVWGTCAGMIFMAKRIDQEQPTLGIMDIAVQRNAFGRQVDSFTCDLDIPALHQYAPVPFPAVFIRAPRLIAVKGHARLLACLPDGSGVAAREGHWLVSAFHPELTGDERFHRYFLSLIAEAPP